MAVTANKGFLQPTGFSVVINKGYYANLEYFAQSVTHPGSNVEPLELPIRQITSVPLAGDKITYTELELSIILDEDIELMILFSSTNNKEDISRYEEKGLGT